MKRNSGIIGPEQKVNATTATGTFDTFDQHLNKSRNAWPNTPPSIRLTLNNTVFNEGQTLTATIYTSGIDAGTSLTYKISFLSGNALQNTDFSSKSGIVNVAGNYINVINITISSDGFTEGTEQFEFSAFLTNDNSITDTQTFTVNDTSTGTPEPSALYDFSTFTFTNANATLQNGPTLSAALAAYDTVANDWLTNTEFFNLIDPGMQIWTVPASGNYEFIVKGASGGDSYTGYGNGVGGRGAVMTATLSLNQGEKLYIAVGQQGGSTGSSSCGQDGGGGGGSFVATFTNKTPLIVAGGGGGAGSNGQSREEALKDAPDSTAGNKGSGTTGGAGGTNGNGGAVQSGSCVNGGGSGAGFYGNGAINGQSTAALSFTHPTPLVGGTSNNNRNGGFGGGGGAGTSYAAGGGGGYSGGGGGGLQTCSCSDMGNGGAGGSYCITSYTFALNTTNTDGSVTVTRL